MSALMSPEQMARRERWTELCRKQARAEGRVFGAAACAVATRHPAELRQLELALQALDEARAELAAFQQEQS